MRKLDRYTLFVLIIVLWNIINAQVLIAGWLANEDSKLKARYWKKLTWVWKMIEYLKRNCSYFYNVIRRMWEYLIVYQC